MQKGDQSTEKKKKTKNKKIYVYARQSVHAIRCVECDEIMQDVHRRSSIILRRAIFRKI